MGQQYPRKQVQEGLKQILILVEVELQAGSASEWTQTMSTKEKQTVDDAVTWLDSWVWRRTTLSEDEEE